MYFLAGYPSNRVMVRYKAVIGCDLGKHYWYPSYMYVCCPCNRGSMHPSLHASIMLHTVISEVPLIKEWAMFVGVTLYALAMLSNYGCQVC